MSDKAVLDGKKVKIVSDLIEWAKAFEKGDKRHVANVEKDGVRVSTVFLGLDHGWGGTPQWFETMIFGGPHDGEQWRYETWAEAGHKHAMTIAFDQESKKEK